MPLSIGVVYRFPSGTWIVGQGWRSFERRACCEPHQADLYEHSFTLQHCCHLLPGEEPVPEADVLLITEQLERAVPHAVLAVAVFHFTDPVLFWRFLQEQFICTSLSFEQQAFLQLATLLEKGR